MSVWVFLWGLLMKVFDVICLLFFEKLFLGEIEGFVFGFFKVWFFCRVVIFCIRGSWSDDVCLVFNIRLIWRFCKSKWKWWLIWIMFVKCIWLDFLWICDFIVFCDFLLEVEFLIIWVLLVFWFIFCRGVFVYFKEIKKCGWSY